MNTRAICRFGLRSPAAMYAATCAAVCVVFNAYAAWLDEAWPHRQKVTIAGTLAAAETLTNFPALVQITAQDNPIFRKAQTNAQDIVFTAADGVTRLAHEIDSFGPDAAGNRVLNAWVRVPELAPGVETVLYLYYGNPVAGDQQDGGTVWEEYAGVWHLEEEKSGIDWGRLLYRDSTTNANHGRDLVSTNSLVGRIGNGSGMDGDDYIQLSRTLYTTNDFTITAWVNPDRLDWEPIAGDQYNRYFMLLNSSQLIGRSAYSNEGHEATYGYNANLETGVWQHVAFRSTGEEGSARGFYKNGAQLSASLRMLNLPLAADPWTLIGSWARSSGNGKFFHGILDEVRISDKALPPAWLDAEYRNASAPSAYVTVEEEEGAAPSWPAAYFAHRQEVAVAPGMTQAVLTNFPMLVAITDPAHPLFASAAADGGDILFTAADGVTPLPHEIERYSAAAPASLYAWVRLPVLYPAAPTRFYLYYGRNSAFAAINKTNVWSEGYLGVWHLSEPVTHGQTNYESTASAAHGVFQDAGGQGDGDAAGKIAGAVAFGGVEDHYVLTPGVQCSSNGFTVSAWVNCASTNQNRIFESSDRTTAYFGVWRDRALVSVYSDGSSWGQKIAQGTSGSIREGVWHHLAAVCVPPRITLYRDGNYNAQSTLFTNVYNQIRAKYIGGYMSTNFPFYGLVDEVRVSSALRTPEWIKACYQTQNEPGAALSFMPPEYRAPRGTMITVR